MAELQLVIVCFLCQLFSFLVHASPEMWRMVSRQSFIALAYYWELPQGVFFLSAMGQDATLAQALAGPTATEHCLTCRSWLSLDDLSSALLVHFFSFLCRKYGDISLQD